MEDEDMNEEIKQRDSERVAEAYRTAAQELAREQGSGAAGVIIYGALATCLRRQELEFGEATATAAALIEQLCGDVLAIAAADELGIVRSLCAANWLSDNWTLITERAQQLPANPPPGDTPEESAYRTVATQMALAVAADHQVARAVLSGAAAVARLRRHIRSDVETSTEDQIRAMARTDPAVATAWDELDDAARRGPGGWVVYNWGEICTAAEELHALNTAEERWMPAEQRMELVERDIDRDALLEKVEVPYLYRQEVTTAERYRRAGEQFARERGYNAVECVYAGVCAETWYRGEGNDSVAFSIAGVHLEVICGDPLAARSTAELGTIEALRYMDWVRVHWDEIGELAAAVEIDQWRKRDGALGRAAMELASAIPLPDLTTAAMLYTGAVSALRYNHPGLRDRIEEEVARVEAADPLLAMARLSMSDVERTKQVWWVEAHWSEIVSAAADLAQAEGNASHGASMEQMELITRHEVRHWARTTLPDATLDGVPGLAYLEAAAVALALYPDLCADDTSLSIHVRTDDAVRATDAENALPDELRARLREGARARWAPLAEALNS